MTVYYNEIKPEAAHMLLHLIKDGVIAPGDVDNRPIQEVRPDDLKGYSQCHFFAGIGGWSVALRLAGWPDDKPVWTGSCPCQPFSTAGKQKGKADDRHLWPNWFRLIAECRPPVVYGEQVRGAIRFGWWDDAADDLEGIGYTTRAEVRPASSVGAPHKRERLWFVANTKSDKSGRIPEREIFGQSGHEIVEDVPNTISIGQQGSGCKTIQRKPRESREFERSSAEWNNGWPVSAPKICGVADGILGRTSILHAFGNAIVPQVAAEFIKKYPAS